MPAASQATSAPGCLPAQQNVGSDSMASAPSSRHELWVEGALGAEAVFRRSRWAMADPAGSPGRQRHRLGATAAAARISNDQPWPDRPARCPRQIRKSPPEPLTVNLDLKSRADRGLDGPGARPPESTTSYVWHLNSRSAGLNRRLHSHQVSAVGAQTWWLAADSALSTPRTEWVGRRRHTGTFGTSGLVRLAEILVPAMRRSRRGSR